MPEPKESKSNKHFQISVYKSFIRIAGCATALGPWGLNTSVTFLAVSFLVAEILGIIEEL